MTATSFETFVLWDHRPQSRRRRNFFVPVMMRSHLNTPARPPDPSKNRALNEQSLAFEEVCHRIEAIACEHIGMDRIVVDPQIHFGKPCVAGTRIPVQNVLELLNEELSFADIIRDYYSELRSEDIRACLQYAIALVAAEDINLVSA